MNHKLKILLAVATIWAAAPAVFAEPATTDWKSFNYKVLRVVDGDTLEATDGNIKFKVRIVGMDAPEKNQSYGKVAKENLANLVLGKKIKLQPVKSGLDAFGRTLAQVFVGDNDVSLISIEQGLAVYYRPSCKDYPDSETRYNYDPRAYVAAEAKAKKEKLNIWSDPKFELPCEFRKKEK